MYPLKAIFKYILSAIFWIIVLIVLIRGIFQSETPAFTILLGIFMIGILILIFLGTQCIKFSLEKLPWVILKIEREFSIISQIDRKLSDESSEHSEINELEQIRDCIQSYILYFAYQHKSFFFTNPIDIYDFDALISRPHGNVVYDFVRFD